MFSILGVSMAKKKYDKNISVYQIKFKNFLLGTRTQLLDEEIAFVFERLIIPYITDKLISTSHQNLDQVIIIARRIEYHVGYQEKSIYKKEEKQK